MTRAMRRGRPCRRRGPPRLRRSGSGGPGDDQRGRGDGRSGRHPGAMPARASAMRLHALRGGERARRLIAAAVEVGEHGELGGRQRIAGRSARRRRERRFAPSAQRGRGGVEVARHYVIAYYLSADGLDWSYDSLRSTSRCSPHSPPPRSSPALAGQPDAFTMLAVVVAVTAAASWPRSGGLAGALTTAIALPVVGLAAAGIGELLQTSLTAAGVLYTVAVTAAATPAPLRAGRRADRAPGHAATARRLHRAGGVGGSFGHRSRGRCWPARSPRRGCRAVRRARRRPACRCARRRARCRAPAPRSSAAPRSPRSMSRPTA